MAYLLCSALSSLQQLGGKGLGSSEKRQGQHWQYYVAYAYAPLMSMSIHIMRHVNEISALIRRINFIHKANPVQARHASQTPGLGSAITAPFPTNE